MNYFNCLASKGAHLGSLGSRNCSAKCLYLFHRTRFCARKVPEYVRRPTEGARICVNGPESRIEQGCEAYSLIRIVPKFVRRVRQSTLI